MTEHVNIFGQISLNTEVCYANDLDCVHTFKNQHESHLHVVGSGQLIIELSETNKLVLTAPAAIFVGNGSEYRVLNNELSSTEFACATIKFSNLITGNLARKLLRFSYREYDMQEPISATVNWLLNEALGQTQDQHFMLDRLTDIFILQLLRDLFNNGLVQQPLAPIVDHPRLNMVLDAIHQAPAKHWSLEALSNIAAMSRSKFAALFKKTMGVTPNSYITEHRLKIAQHLLMEGKSISSVANEVGYEHGSALARVFKKHLGVSPSKWRHNKLHQPLNPGLGHYA